MVRTKQTQHGGSLTRPAGIQVAVHGDQPKADWPEAEQFEDLEEADETTWPDFNNPHKVAEQGEASKSTGKTGEGSQDVDKPTRAEGGAQVPPNVVQDLTQPKSSTSKGDTQAPVQAPTQDPSQDPAQDLEDVPSLTDYVKSYRQAAKVWFDTVQVTKEQVYTMLYDTLLTIGDPHIPKFSDSDRKTVLDCVADKSGKFLSEDKFAVYIEKEDVEIKKMQVKVSGDAKEAIKGYYQAAHDLCQTQTTFMECTRVLESKLDNKELFLDIIRQVQLPAVHATVRTREQEETLEGKTYRELTLSQHLSNYRKIYPNANEQSRTMAAFIYYVLHKQITGIQKSQTGCSEEFRCQTTSFKPLVTEEEAARWTRQNT